MPQDPVETLQQSPSNGKLSNIPSLSNLYNSHSNKGSSTTLQMSNSAVFNNGAGLVHKGTIAHVDNAAKSHIHQQDEEDDDDDDDAFEMNWVPQVSSDNHTSGYQNRI